MNIRNLIQGSVVTVLIYKGIKQLLFRQNLVELRGQVALVTGGSRGLGLLIARELGHKGCRTAICARDDDELERAKQNLAEWGVDDVFTVVCDVSVQEEVSNLIEDVEKEFGTIDLLINNAGVIQTGPIQSQEIEDFEQSLDIMFWDTLYPSLKLLPGMVQRNKGHIINITSIGGKLAVPHLLPYGVAKFATVAFSEGLAAETQQTGVHVMTVIPGLMRTGSYLNAFFKGDHQNEYQWFAISDNLPFISISAERAARKIVDAIRRKDTELVVTIPAKILIFLHGLFPVLTIKLLGLINMFLPAGSNPHKKRGKTIQATINSPVFNFLTRLGRSAAQRFNQLNPEDKLFNKPTNLKD